MQGAGNDFILIDNRNNSITEEWLAGLAPSICNRKFGVGSDGIIALSEDSSNKSNLVMLYKNPDGSDAGMCGNGARCLAAFAKWLGYGNEFTIRVNESVYKATCLDDSVIIDFPIRTKVNTITLNGKIAYKIYTNTEHVVIPLESFEKLGDEDTLITEGSACRYHKMFEPKGTNVNFIYGKKREELHLQTYERGVENLTLSCGTGAIASAIGWHHLKKSKNGDFSYIVKTKGGTLTIHFSFDDNTKEYFNIQLEGSAVFVFEGDYYI